MPSFAQPWVLILLPCLLVWWIWRFSRWETAILQFMGRMGTGDPKKAVPFPLTGFLRLGAMVLLVLALAGPRSQRPRPLPPDEGIALVIALDLSGSMGLKGMGNESRLDMARGEIARFIRARPQDRIGLVTFGETGLTRVPPTTSHRHLLEVMGDLSVSSADEGTALGTGLGLAAHATLTVPSPSRVVILLTDGRSNTGTLEPLSAAKAAGVLGVRVHAVGIGAAEGEEPLDESLLRGIVQVGGGHYLRARDAAGLRTVLEELDALETGPLGKQAGFTLEPRHRPFLLLAILLFLLEAVFGALPRGRIA